MGYQTNFGILGSMANIVFLEVDPEDEARVQSAFPEAIVIAENNKDEGVIDELVDAEVISCFIYSKFDAAALDKLPNLKLLCTRSVGCDHIDLQACKDRGITVCNVPDYGSHVISEHVFALLLGTLRHVHTADERVEGGEFDYSGLRGVALKEKTIGIVGTGKIGRTVAKIAYGFGMKILAYDRCRVLELTDYLHAEYTDLDDLLARSDIITLHLPVTEDTTHVIDAEAFGKMKDGVILVNTARGALINSPDLLEAVKSGKVAHALLDVLENEKNYEENKELINHPNVVTTPHIAFYADDSMRNMFEDCFTSIREYLNGEEPEHIFHPPEKICDITPITKK